MQNHEDLEKSAREGRPDSPRQQGDSADERAPVPIESPRDTQLGAPAPTSHRKRQRAASQAPPEDNRLALPRGGLVAMRMSGGFRFGSREICVYRSGKIAYVQTAPALISETRQLPLSQLVEMHHLLKQSDLARLPATAGRQSGDAFAYEIVARVGRVVRSVEVFEGSIPDSLAPLIHKLKQLMPVDAVEDARPTSEPENGE
jgi:hypothetical protein